MDRIIDIKVAGNYLSKNSNNAGTQYEGNASKLRITFDESWDGYAKKVTWWDATGQNPAVQTLTTNLLEDILVSTRVYLVPIPPEPLMIAGECTVIIDGYVNGARQRSVSGSMTVKDAPVLLAEDTPGDLTPTQAEQIQAEIDAIKDTIQNAAISADEAADSAEDAAQSAAEAAGSASDAEKFAKEAEKSAQNADYSESEAKYYAEKAEDSAETAQEYSGKPPIIQDGTWWTWDAANDQYVDTGKPAQGNHGAYTEADGLWGVGVEGNDLMLYYQGELPPPLSIEGNNLIYTLDDGNKIDLGRVRFDPGPGIGDMLADIYDPQKKEQDVFAYADGAAGTAKSEAIAAAEADATAKANAAEAAAKAASRPNTWTPTAAEVGARPDTWTPTPAQIGAATPADLANYLPLTGGTLTGDLYLYGGHGRIFANKVRTFICSNDNANDTKNFRAIAVCDRSIPLNDSLKFHEDNDGSTTTFKIYGEHNVTAGTAAITAGSALATGCLYHRYK